MCLIETQADSVFDGACLIETRADNVFVILKTHII